LTRLGSQPLSLPLRQIRRNRLVSVVESFKYEWPNGSAVRQKRDTNGLAFESATPWA